MSKRRFGQDFCNRFIITDSELYYETDDAKAYNIAYTKYQTQFEQFLKEIYSKIESENQTSKENMNDTVTIERGEKVMNRDEMMAWLESIGIEVVGTSERFGSGKGGIWINGEDNDYRLNYWTENYTDYTFGIENKLNEEVEKRGWWFEWYDAGTLMCFPQ